MTVTVFFPTYRNAEVFRFCLRSVLNQSNTDLEVFIYDNGLSDGHSEVRDLVQTIGDPRVNYSANNENIGSINNYKQIFRHASTVDQAIVLAADSGLRSDAIDSMLQCREEHDADWIRPKAVLYPLKNLGVAEQALTPNKSSEVPKSRSSSSAEVLCRFFGDENLDGEFDRASWAGSLIDGSIWRNANVSSVPFRWHGAEQYITMRLLLSEFKVAFIDADLEVAITGAVRYGTDRPDGDFTRLETIQAKNLLLREHRAAVTRWVSSALCHQRKALLRFLKIRRGNRLAALNLLAYTLVQEAVAGFGKRFL